MKFLRVLLPLFAIILFQACTNEDSNGDPRLVLKLIDSAGEYEEVNIHVVGAEINVDGEWQTLDVEEKVYDLCKLVNGTSEVIADQDIPAGEVQELRLILGEDNTLKIKDVTEPVKLSTPSGQSSGYKIKIQETLTTGITYTLIMDFDAARSIVKAGNSGKYNLKPVVRAFPEALDGAISGTVEPLESNPAVYAIIGEDTITSTFPDDNGFFMLRGLDQPAYKVGLEPVEGYVEKVFEEVPVTIGEINDLGTIEIEEEQ